MFQKSRILAVATMAAGTIGLCASAASAGTYNGPSGDNGGLVNISHNQVPVQACNNQVPVNVLGVQVPVNRVAGALGLLFGSGTTIAAQNEKCTQQSVQANTPTQEPQSASVRTVHKTCCSMSGDGWAWHYEGPSGDNGGLVNISHNQVPVQVCNNRVPVNVLGVQVPVDTIAGALGILGSGTTTASQNSSCWQGSAQHNN
jgi:hypothetical protein